MTNIKYEWGNEFYVIMINKNADLNDIDVSKIDSFYIKDNNWGIFEYLDPHNIKIDKWDVSHVTNMRNMFSGCEFMDCDLSNWDVSNVTDMWGIFYGCKNFTGIGLETWNVGNVQNMNCAFTDCRKLIGKELENWDVSQVIVMTLMFAYCKKFNVNLSNWDVSNVQYMDRMFSKSPLEKNPPKWYKE